MGIDFFDEFFLDPILTLSLPCQNTKKEFEYEMETLICSFFLIPILIHASHFYDKQYARIIEKIVKEWQRHEELLVQFSKLSLEEKENHLDLLNKSIACCHRAIDHCDYILRKIAEKPKYERHDDYWVKAKNDRKQNKKDLLEIIKKIQGFIEQTKKEIAISKANSHFQQSQEKANLAYFKSQNFLPLRFNNVEQVVMAFNEIAHFYEEALHYASAALNFIAPYADEENKKFLRESIETYRQAAAKFKQNAMQWPAVAEFELAANKAKLAALKEESMLLAEKGFDNNAHEVQKQIIPILEFLILNLPGESASYEEELSQMRMSLEEHEKQAELSKEVVNISENQARDIFYKSEFLLNPERFVQNLLTKTSRPSALSLDVQTMKNGNTFALCPEQFYRFLIESDIPVCQR